MRKQPLRVPHRTPVAIQRAPRSKRTELRQSKQAGLKWRDLHLAQAFSPSDIYRLSLIHIYGARQVRFTFCKRDETLEAAATRLEKLHV